MVTEYAVNVYKCGFVYGFGNITSTSQPESAITYNYDYVRICVERVIPDSFFSNTYDVRVQNKLILLADQTYKNTISIAFNCPQDNCTNVDNNNYRPGLHSVGNDMGCPEVRVRRAWPTALLQGTATSLLAITIIITHTTQIRSNS